MKKNFIKVLFITVSALLCSQIWAQGSESESSRAYAKTYTISVKKENETIVQTLQLTTKNGRTELTSGMMPAGGYSAFFIADDGTYYGFDYDSSLPEGQRAVWKYYNKTEQISYVNKIRSYLAEKNCHLTTEDENELEDISYSEIKTSDLPTIDGYKFIRTTPTDFEKLYIYNDKKGIFFLAVKESTDSDKVKVVCFRDKQSKAEIIDNLNENDFKNWLNASKESKENNAHNEEYKRLSKLIYESLKNHGGFKNLYSDNFEKFYKIYLQVALENNKNVYFSELTQKDKTYKPDDYKINISANKQIKDAAQTYTNLTITKGILFWKKTINLSFDYKDNQSDTPDIYKLKYQKQKDNKISDAVLSNGCDDIGFLNGILYSSFKSGDIKVRDNDKLVDTYDQYEKEIKDLKKKDSNIPVMKNVIKSFNDDELNKISIVIPELKDVKAGDIVFFTKKEQKHNEIDINTKKKCAVIMEDGNISKKVEDFQVIIMDEEKGAIQESLKNIWKTKDSFEIPEITEIRRILTVGQASNTNINWNVLNENVANETIEVLCMREDFQTSGEKFRFIPNTGEYLSMEKIRLNAYNQLGIRVRGDEWKVTINGAKDRNYKSGNTDGNVYNNSECNFNIKVGEKTGVLSKTSNGNYKITWIKQDGTTDKEPVFEIKTKDNLLFYGSDALEIKIRPENAANARPGDDLLLEFKLTKPGVTDKYITLSEKDYIAVYDKKIMWRANLFLEKIESELGYLDWNDAHPWNAPNSDSNNSNIWFGKNEWNNPESDYKGISGGQIITLPSTKWYYGASSLNKTINKAVAYDHQGWDNPFSFKSKMNDQKELMNQWYTNDLKLFAKPVFQWPETVPSTITAIKSYIGNEVTVTVGTSDSAADKLKKYQDKYKELRENKDNRFSKDLSEINNYKNYIYPNKYGTSVSPYVTSTEDGVGGGGTSFIPSFLSPVNKLAVGSEGLTVNGKTIYPYLPGLSDSLMPNLNKYPHKLIGRETAGIDCNGLVQISSAYNNSFYSALGKSTKSRNAPVFWNDSESKIPNSVMKYFRNEDTIDENGKVTYGNSGDNRTSICVGTFKPDKNLDYYEIIDGIPSLKTKNIYTYFKNIVPGDLIWYSGHIMIVSSIDAPDGYDDNNEPYWNNGSAVHILESVYSNGNDAFGVVNKRNVNQLTSNEKYWGIWRQQ